MTKESFAHGLVGVILDGRYRLDAVLGEGGMGSVFRATQLAMDRKVAVKLLKPHLASDDDALQRFAREARATLKVESSHAVKILDFGVTPLRDYYMVLEYLDGRTVQRELDIDGPFAPARVAHIAQQALDALAAAHDRGLIHRDVKPDNLLLMRVADDPDYTKILDFGVAKLMQGTAGDPAMLALTAAGVVFGTPEFMSPEQACGQALDGRSDLYSLAVTMFVMLTGEAPFEGDTAIECLTHHVRTPAPRLAMVRPELAAYPELDDLMQRCLAKQPDQRPAGAAELAALIAAIEPTLTRNPSSGSAALGGSVALGHGPGRVARPRTPTRVSSYVQALRDTERAPAAIRSGVGSMPTVLAPAATSRGRRPAFWFAGVAIASLIGLGVGLVLDRAESRIKPTANGGGGEPRGGGPGPEAQASGVAAAGAASAVARGESEQPNRAGGVSHTGSAHGSEPRAGAIAAAGAVSAIAPGAEPAAANGVGRPPATAAGRALQADAVAALGAGPAMTAGHAGEPAPANGVGGPGHALSSGSASHPARPAIAPAPSAPSAPPAPLARPVVAKPERSPLRTTPPADAPAPARTAEAEQHLRGAEDAFQGNNQLKQLAEADLALRADPQSIRAKYLLGDALIKGGDLDRGCSQLRALTHYAPARDRARAAGCPGD